MLGYSENGKQIYYTQYYSTQRSGAECAPYGRAAFDKKRYGSKWEELKRQAALH